MKTNQHSPAPWEVAGRPYSIKIVDADGKAVAMIKPRREAWNGDLIAAAPALLVALEAIEARINGVYDCPALVAFGPLHDTQSDCLRIAKEAIAKANIEEKQRQAPEMNAFIKENLTTILEAARIAFADSNLFDQLAEDLDLSDEAMIEIRDGLQTYLNSK